MVNIPHRNLQMFLQLVALTLRFWVPLIMSFAAFHVSSSPEKEQSYSFYLAVPQPVHPSRLFIQGSASHWDELVAQHGEGLQSWLSQDIN